MNKADKEFVGYTVTECAKKNISIIFLPKRLVDVDSTKCSGYFDEDGRKLLVATKKAQRDWLPVLSHEFSHFQQWSQKDPLFMKLTNNENLNGDMWEWLKGENIPMNRVRKSIRAYQELELDCEKRSVEHIKNFGLSININEYIKMANVYVLFYGIVLKTRKWYESPPYQCNELLKVIPNKFITSFKMPEKFEKICLKECW